MTRNYDIQKHVGVTYMQTSWENSGCNQSIFSFIAFGNNLSLCLLFPNGNGKQMRTEWHLMCNDGGAACKFQQIFINPLSAELNPICHLLALLGAHHIFHVSRIRVKFLWQRKQIKTHTCLPLYFPPCPIKTLVSVTKNYNIYL